MVAEITRRKTMPLEEFVANPPEKMELVDGKLMEKDGMTLRHGKIQLRLGRLWEDYQKSTGQGGEVYTDVPCRTHKQGRSPDVAYLTSELVAQFGSAAALPQSFPLCAEIVSPTDLGENILLKAQEYLESGGEEVWLVYPESHWVVIITKAGGIMFSAGQIAKTQKLLPGFEIAVNELLN